MTAVTDLSDPKSLIRGTVTCLGQKRTQEDLFVENVFHFSGTFCHVILFCFFWLFL